MTTVQKVVTHPDVGQGLKVVGNKVVIDLGTGLYFEGNKIAITPISPCGPTLDLTPNFSVGAGAADVNRNGPFTVTFPAAMAGTTAGLLQMQNADSGFATVAGAWATTDNMTFTFTPTGGQLAAYTNYRIAIAANVALAAPYLCTGNQGALTRNFRTAAASALQLLTKAPGTPSGEYIFQPDGVTTQFKSYADMVTDGGGWTLIWSYSEQTAISTYGTGNISVPATYQLRQNQPQNRGTGAITYANMRLTNADMLALRSGTLGQYRGRMTNGPGAADDTLAQQNYFIAKPAAATYDFVQAGSSMGAYQGTQLPTKGRIVNIPFTVGLAADGVTLQAGGTVNGVATSGLYWYNSAYPECFDTHAVTGLPAGLDSFGYYGSTHDPDHFGLTTTAPHNPMWYMQWFIR